MSKLLYFYRAPPASPAPVYFIVGSCYSDNLLAIYLGSLFLLGPILGPATHLFAIHACSLLIGRSQRPQWSICQGHITLSHYFCCQTQTFSFSVNLWQKTLFTRKIAGIGKFRDQPPFGPLEACYMDLFTHSRSVQTYQRTILAH